MRRPISLECKPPAALVLHPNGRPAALLVWPYRGAPPQTLEPATWDAHAEAAAIFTHLPDVRPAIAAARAWLEKRQQVTAPTKGAAGEMK